MDESRDTTALTDAIMRLGDARRVLQHEDTLFPETIRDIIRGENIQVDAASASLTLTQPAGCPLVVNGQGVALWMLADEVRVLGVAGRTQAFLWPSRRGTDLFRLRRAEPAVVEALAILVATCGYTLEDACDMAGHRGLPIPPEWAAGQIDRRRVGALLMGQPALQAAHQAITGKTDLPEWFDAARGALSAHRDTGARRGCIPTPATGEPSPRQPAVYLSDEEMADWERELLAQDQEA